MNQLLISGLKASAPLLFTLWKSSLGKFILLFLKCFPSHPCLHNKCVTIPKGNSLVFLDHSGQEMTAKKRSKTHWGNPSDRNSPLHPAHCQKAWNRNKGRNSLDSLPHTASIPLSLMMAFIPSRSRWKNWATLINCKGMGLQNTANKSPCTYH